jgi:predicted enzyme related to lactoylglutathione lyase
MLLLSVTQSERKFNAPKGVLMAQSIKLIVYPVKDITASKILYSKLLGVEPYVDTAYYVGFGIGELEIGLDPNAHRKGVTSPIGYVDVTDIIGSLQTLLDAGAQVQQEIQDVGGGMLIATVKDADGNILGLRQAP